MIEAELSKYTFQRKAGDRAYRRSDQTAEPPVICGNSQERDSSIVKGMNMVKQKEADAFVSAGSSGAILVGGQVIVGRIKGVERPPLAPLIPTKNGVSL